MGKLWIMVRSRRLVCGNWISEWTQTCHSWKSAWAVVAEAAERTECRVWSLTDRKRSAGSWFIDIGGNEELEDLRSRQGGSHD
jgi:hypothetical protein